MIYYWISPCKDTGYSSEDDVTYYNIVLVVSSFIVSIDEQIVLELEIQRGDSWVILQLQVMMQYSPSICRNCI